MANERFPADRSEESNLFDRIITSAGYARRTFKIRRFIQERAFSCRTYLPFKGLEAGGFDRGHPGVLLRPADHGSNVHSSRTANSERVFTTRNASAMAILHRRSENGASGAVKK